MEWEERAVSRRLLSPLPANVVRGDEVYSLVYHTQQERPPAGETRGSEFVSDFVPPGTKGIIRGRERLRCCCSASLSSGLGSGSRPEESPVPVPA